MERWADMPGFEDFYEISDHGNARSKERKYYNSQGRLITKHSKELKPLVGNNGYIRFGLKKPEDTKVYKVLAHRMVAIAFIPNPNNLDEVGHKDDIRWHNNYTNLYWTTHRDNIVKAVNSGRIDFKPIKQANNIRTILIDSCNRSIEFESQGEAAKYLGVTQGAISMALKNNGLCQGYKVLAIRKITEVDKTSDVVENSAITSTPVLITNGDISITCNSLNSAAKKLNRNISSVISAFYNGTKCNGYNIYKII